MHLAMLLKCPEGLSFHVLDHFLGGNSLIESLVCFLKTVVKEGPPTQEEQKEVAEEISKKKRIEDAYSMWRKRFQIVSKVSVLFIIVY